MSKDQNYWNEAHEGAADGGGLGDVIAKGLVELGFYAYVSGFGGEAQSECIFYSKGGKTKEAREKARDVAEAKAIKFAEKHGKDSDSVRWCFLTHIYHEEAMRVNGKEVDTWSGDQLSKVPTWTLRTDTASMAKIVEAALVEHGVRPNKPFYARFGKVNDPYQVAKGDAGKKEGGDGVMRWPSEWVVKEVYSSREAAADAVGTPPADDGDAPDWAGDWKAAELEETYHAFVEQKDEYDDFAALVKGEAEEPIEWAIKVLSEIGEMDIDEIVTFTGMKRGKVRKALKS